MTTPKKKKAVVTTVAGYKKKNINERTLELPSGAVFRVKDVDLQSMLTKGYISLELLTTLMATGQTIAVNQTTKKPELDNIEKEQLGDIDKLARQFAVIAVVSPKLSLEDEQDSINVADIDFTDILFVFSNCVRGGAAKFAPFFQKGAPGSALAQSGGGVQPEAIRDNAD